MSDIKRVRGDPDRGRAQAPEPNLTESQSEAASELAWDLVDEASFESFPASDPPGWISRRRINLDLSLVAATKPKGR